MIAGFDKTAEYRSPWRTGGRHSIPAIGGAGGGWADAHELHALVPIAQGLVDQVRHLGGEADPTAERRLHAISDAYQHQQGGDTHA